MGGGLDSPAVELDGLQHNWSSCPWHSRALGEIKLSSCQSADSVYCLWLLVGQSEVVGSAEGVQ